LLTLVPHKSLSSSSDDGAAVAQAPSDDLAPALQDLM
jgi:hypothetical protein